MKSSASRPPPPGPLEDAFADPVAKQAYVDWVFDRVAPRYDLGNDVMSLGWHRRWKQRTVAFARVLPHHRVLDLAAGTGDVTFLLGREATDGEVVGVDINERMLDIARRRRPAELGHVRFERADATALPYADRSFDLVTCVYAGRGFPDFPAVVREAYRVLRPGGVFLNLDFARPPRPWFDALYRRYLRASGAALGLALHGDARAYTYIPDSLGHYPGQRWLDGLMRDAGFQTWLVESAGGVMAWNIGERPAG